MMVFQVQINRRKQQFCLLGTKIKLFKVLEKQKWAENLTVTALLCVFTEGDLLTADMIILLILLVYCSCSRIGWLNYSPRAALYFSESTSGKHITQTYMLLYSSGVEFLMSPIKSVVSYYKKEWGQIEDYCAWHSSFIRATLSQQTSLAMFSQCLVIAEK